MKVLWLTNIVFPEATKLLYGASEFKSSGGWMISLANDFAALGDVDLSIASVSSKVKTLTILHGSRITYYILPWRRGDRFCSYKKDMITIKELTKPEVIHIHGTDSVYGLYYVKACGPQNVVVSIQGVMKAIAEHCNDGLSFFDLLSSITMSDLIHRNSLYHIKRRFYQTAILEEKLLRQVSHIIGRTGFDKHFVDITAPHAIYHHCNESLRDEFYDGIWSYSNCLPHSIFLSQCPYPVKGLHQAITVFPLLKAKYPDFKVYIAGMDVRCQNTGYGKLLKKRFKNLGLDEYVTFLGPLSAEEMRASLLKTNVFLSPSTIENSPNSIGEAQILGVPVVASAVGGVPTMVSNRECGSLYSFDNKEDLFLNICDIFENSHSFNNSVMRSVASDRHNKMVNTNAVLLIYRQIINSYE